MKPSCIAQLSEFAQVSFSAADETEGEGSVGSYRLMVVVGKSREAFMLSSLFEEGGRHIRRNIYNWFIRDRIMVNRDILNLRESNGDCDYSLLEDPNSNLPSFIVKRQETNASEMFLPFNRVDIVPTFPSELDSVDRDCVLEGVRTMLLFLDSPGVSVGLPNNSINDLLLNVVRTL